MLPFALNLGSQQHYGTLKYNKIRRVKGNTLQINGVLISSLRFKGIPRSDQVHTRASLLNDGIKKLGVRSQELEASGHYAAQTISEAADIFLHFIFLFS